ncbi:uncharacterized protein [Procambarus clarkii]|uniref:uncharacterized protein n=1 Tax=Procambarus clarkii TaxID=6728 RepID=UPI00374483BB
MLASATHQEDDLQQYGEEDASYTEEEIERAFREDFPTNDFWTDENNVDILQCILDKEFNSEPGYEYEASYMDCSTPRLIVICLVRYSLCSCFIRVMICCLRWYAPVITVCG